MSDDDDVVGRMGRHTSLDVLNIGPPTPPISSTETPSPSNAETPSPINGHPLPRSFSRSNSTSSRRSSSSRQRGDDDHRRGSREEQRGSRDDRRASRDQDDREHRISENEIRELTTLLSFLHKDVTTLITRVN